MLTVHYLQLGIVVRQVSVVGPASTGAEEEDLLCCAVVVVDKPLGFPLCWRVVSWHPL